MGHGTQVAAGRGWWMEGRVPWAGPYCKGKVRIMERGAGQVAVLCRRADELCRATSGLGLGEDACTTVK